MLRFFFAFMATVFALHARLPDLKPNEVTSKANEIMKAHASQKELTPQLTKRVLNNFLENLDPNKTYFIEEDVEPWIHPTDELLEKVVEDFQHQQFDTFEDMQKSLSKAILRRQQIENRMDYQNLPKHVQAEEFKDIPWAKSDEELVERLRRIRALQLDTAAKLSDSMRENAMQRINKRQQKYEEEGLNTDARERKKIVHTNFLKALASALDAHTAYFTPAEATQFMINVQQRLFGVGAQLRDDINGFTVVKLVEGGPAALSKEIKVKDRIIAVDGVPVVGMDISDAVELIRGEENTPVVLTIIRESSDDEGNKKEEKLDVTLTRGEVVLKESRFKTSYEPYGDGVIGYLKLYSFYQDKESSSAMDLEKEINQLKEKHRLLGIILDLRYNSGGLLSQAVSVTGLFISKGVVVSIKDENGKVQHLRDLDGTIAWDGPLVVLVNRMSASASEIVAQTLQDYGRAIVVGDDHTYGKGSYQTFTLTTTDNEQVNPEGEYKVTRGRYYTVSGKTPQLTGVIADVQIPGPLSETEIGEQYIKYPLENDHIKSNYDDDLSDIPFLQRDKIKKLYKYGLQEKLDIYQPYIKTLGKNTKDRLDQNPNYQNLLIEIKKKDDIDIENMEDFGQNDIQLEEAYNVMKDILLIMQEKGLLHTPTKRKHKNG